MARRPVTTHIERLTLPEPARTLWPDCHTLLERFFGDPDRRDGGYVVGGGTILAARLGHRTSFDIDPIITSRPDLLEYLEGAPRHRALRNAMVELSFTNRREHPPLQLTLEHRHGRLDLFAGYPFPASPPAFAELDGRRTAVASNLQIMTGKLRGRITRAPVRDLIDIAVTAAGDRDACQLAINSVPARILATLPSYLMEKHELYLHASAKDEARLADPWQHLKQDPTRPAIAAIRTLAWQRIDVTYGPEGAFFTAYEGEEPRLLDRTPITDPGTFDRRLAELGIPYGRDPETNHSHGATQMMRALKTQDLTIVRAKEFTFVDTTALERTRTATHRKPGAATTPARHCITRRTATSDEHDDRR